MIVFVGERLFGDLVGDRLMAGLVGDKLVTIFGGGDRVLINCGGDLRMGLKRGVVAPNASRLIGLSFGIVTLISFENGGVSWVAGFGDVAFGVLVCGNDFMDMDDDGGLRDTRLASFALELNSSTIALMSELEHFSEITTEFGDVVVPLLLRFVSSIGISGNLRISI